MQALIVWVALEIESIRLDKSSITVDSVRRIICSLNFGSKRNSASQSATDIGEDSMPVKPAQPATGHRLNVSESK